MRFKGETGEPLETLPRPASGPGYDIVTTTPDGGLLVSTGDELHRFDTNLNPVEGFNSGHLRDLELNTTFPPDAEGLTVDGLGNIYVLDETNSIVMKFGPDGRYLDKFALQEDSSANAIAVDGQGHLYLGDSWRIDVYDLEGRYLDQIEFDGLAFGLAVNTQDELFVASRTQVFKFAGHKQ
jgi:sugar lactone lactonase YvrE